MSIFTKEKKRNFSSSRSIFVKLDSKGRISIPSFLRKNLDLKVGDSLELIFSLRDLYFIVQSSVKVSTDDCESSSPGSNPGSGPKFKKIGILGGMGPESTSLFYQKIIKAYQKSGAVYDDDFPEIFIYNLPIPDVVNGFNNPKTGNFLVQGCKKLELMGADFIAVPCNTVSCFFEDMRNSVSIPIYNIIEETAKFSSKYKSLGLLATKTTVENKLYERVFEKFNIEIIAPENLEEVNKIILNILSGRLMQSDKSKLIKIVGDLTNRGSEAIILGCTDMPLLLKQEDVDIKLIDSLSVYADFTAKYSRR